MGGLVAFVLLAAGLAAGCAAPRVAPVAAPEMTADRLAALLKDRDAAVRTMKGLFSVQVSGGGLPFAQRMEGAMYYRKPGSLRLQGFNRLGGELFEFVLGGDLYRLRLAATGQVYSGQVRDLERMDRIGRPFQLSVLAVSEAIAVEPVPDGQRLLLSEEEDRWRLDVFARDTAGHPLRQLWFERRTFNVVREDRLNGNGEVEASLHFEDYRPVGTPGQNGADGQTSVPLVRPHKVTIKDNQGGGTLSMTFKEIIPNPSLRPEDLDGGARRGDVGEAA